MPKREYQVLDGDENENGEDGGDGFLSLLGVEVGGDVRDDVKVLEGQAGEKLKRLWKGGERDLSAVVMGPMVMEIVVEVKEHKGN